MKDDASGVGGAANLDVYTVSEVSDAIRQHLESEFPRVSVLGETANFKIHTSGHWYFTLRDASAMLHAVVFKRYADTLSFVPEDGMLVVASGRLSHYGGQGRTQLLAVDIIPAGRGALEIEFRRLLEKLMREGLTAPERKRALPPYPERIVVITSQTGAVIKDIRDTISRRWPVAEIVHIPADVQGAGAAGSIVRAFDVANAMEGVDAVILARGGGSIEDLWTFNIEEVARAVAGSTHPTVTGIGHEIDTTIADYVSDLRAATPTAAAELATPLAAEVTARCRGLIDKLYGRARDRAANDRHLVEYLLRSGAFPALRHRLDRSAIAVDDLLGRLEERREGESEKRARAVEIALDGIDRSVYEIVGESRLGVTELLGALGERNPAASVRASRELVKGLTTVLPLRVRGTLALRGAESNGRIRALQGLDPRRVLERGYAICTRPESSAVISRSLDLERGDRMVVNFADGGALCAVERKGEATPWRRRRASSMR